MSALTDQLRRLLSKASPAPWSYQNHFGHYEIDPAPPRSPHFEAIAGHYGSTREDAELIAASRNALPELLDRIEKQEALIEELIAAGDAFDDGIFGEAPLAPTRARFQVALKDARKLLGLPESL
jgi:hypothetical protein